MQNCQPLKHTLWVTLIVWAFFSSNTAFSCTRILKAGRGLATMVGRNMDWDADLQTNLWVYPEGLRRTGTDAANALHWTAKYGSIVATAYETAITTDGMNEKGLAAHLLSLAGSDYGKRDETQAGVSVLMWAQFYLDNFQSVDEAVRFTETNAFQLLPALDAHTNRSIDLHLALEDASGDSAIIEYTNGKPTIYHSREYTVLTNSPTYDRQLLNVKNYQGMGGDKPLPGTTDPMDRFVRATYYTARLPLPESTQEAVAGIMSVIQNTGQPYGTRAHSIWRIVSDLTHQVYYFNSLNRFNTIWVRLDKFKLLAGAPMMKLELGNNPDLVGDVSKYFVPVF
jgi:penicillin V acylase-like amidase (Ntn superfamily)